MRIGICIPFYYNSEESKERLIYLLEIIKDQNFEIFCDVVVVIDGPEIEELKEKGLSVLDYLQGKTVDGITQAKGEVFAIGNTAIDGLNGVYEEVLTIP